MQSTWRPQSTELHRVHHWTVNVDLLLTIFRNTTLGKLALQIVESNSQAKLESSPRSEKHHAEVIWGFPGLNEVESILGLSLLTCHGQSVSSNSDRSQTASCERLFDQIVGMFLDPN